MIAYIMAMPTKTSAGTVEKFQDDNGNEIQKFEIKINDERLIDRTVRLLKDRLSAKDKIVIGGYEEIEGCENYITSEKSFEGHIMDVVKKFSKNRTKIVFFYGDCYYTEAYVDFVLNYKADKWGWVCRMDANPYTGKIWGEGYGMIVAEGKEFVAKTAEWLQLVEDHKVDNSNKWNWNRYLNGLNDIYTHHIGKPSPHDIIWDKDETDDFDYARDVVMFKYRMSKNFGR